MPSGGGGLVINKSVDWLTFGASLKPYKAPVSFTSDALVKFLYYAFCLHLLGPALGFQLGDFSRVH